MAKVKKLKTDLQKSILSYRNFMAIENESIFQQGYEFGTRKTVEFMFYMMAYTLEYKLDLKDDELKEIMYFIMNNIDSFRTDHLNSEDFKEIKRHFNEIGLRMVK